jgi:membrane protease YdiL (CAAX protease family)
MATLKNPFLTLKARLVVLVFFAISIGLALVFGVLGTLGLLPLQLNDPIVAPLLYSLIFGGLCLLVMMVARRPPIHLGDLVGRWPPHLTGGSLMVVVVSVFLFSLGAFQLSYLALALVAPTLVESTLQQSLLLASDATAYPHFYTGLMMFTVLVVAPVTEEFIFRGILLHRWGIKWGVRPAILLTSVLFGVLHSNLVGLFVFGLVMALLYLSSRSLLVPIVAHSMNNAIASGIEFFTLRASRAMPTDTLADFQASWWLGVICLTVSAPWLWRYLQQHWPQAQTQLPYFANQNHNSARANGFLPPEDR